MNSCWYNNMDSTDLQYYKIINKINPSSTNQLRDSFIQDMVDSYNEAEASVITRFRVLVNTNKGKDVKVNGIPKRVLFKYENSKDTDTSKFVMEVESEIGDVKGGDYIEHYDDKLDKTDTYLVFSKAERKLDSEINYIKYCNHLLKFVVNGEYNEIPVIVTNNTKYTAGISTQVVGITEIDSMFGLVLSWNDIGKKIKTGQRFIINDNAWEVSQIDHVTGQGIASILLITNSKNANDNLELEIADYYLHNYTITLNSTSETLQETSTYQIVPNVTDNGVAITNGNIVYHSSDESICTVDNNGLVTALTIGNCVITATIGNVNTTMNIEVIAKSVVPIVSYGYSWSNGVNLKIYMSSTITLNKTVDSVSSPLVVNYNLDSVGATLLNAGSISITKKSDYSYQVKNVNVSTIKSFVITFTDSTDGTIIATQTISLTGM